MINQSSTDQLGGGPFEKTLAMHIEMIMLRENMWRIMWPQNGRRAT